MKWLDIHKGVADYVFHIFFLSKYFADTAILNYYFTN